MDLLNVQKTVSASTTMTKNTVLILGEQSLSAAELTHLLGEPCRNGFRAEAASYPPPCQEMDCLEQTMLEGRRREEGSERGSRLFLSPKPASVSRKPPRGKAGRRRPSPEFSACVGLSPSHRGNCPKRGSCQMNPSICYLPCASLFT